MNALITKNSFMETPQLIEPLFDLLETSFPGIGQARHNAQIMDVKWQSISTPFVIFENCIAKSHVGVLEIPLVVMGASLLVGATHAICTRPSDRRKGLFRKLMTDALGYCSSRYDTVILFTAQPELYEPFGFRVVKEHRFRFQVASKVDANGDFGLRLLDKTVPNDLQLIHSLLNTRAPLSKVLGVGQEKGIFGFNESGRPLYYLEKLNLMVSMEVIGNELHLYDLIGPKICLFSEFMAALQQPVSEVLFYFSPDQLEVQALAEPHIVEGDSNLMVKGPFACELEKFMVPRTARC